MGSLVKISFSSLSTLEDADAVEAFFAQHDRTTYEQALSQGLDSVRSKAAWLKRDVKDVHDWLAANGYIV
jgi:aminopeptidase 2